MLEARDGTVVGCSVVQQWRRGPGTGGTAWAAAGSLYDWGFYSAGKTVLVTPWSCQRSYLHTALYRHS